MARFKLSIFIGTVVVVLSYFGSVGTISSIVTSQCTESGGVGLDPLCQNGGSCLTVGTVGSYCVCQVGYTGFYCEDQLCDPSCMNGGTCVELPSAGRTCLCSPDFAGATCQETATYLSFEELNYAVLETSREVKLKVFRTGYLDKSTSVRVETSDDSAVVDVNYRRLSRVLNFDPFISNLTIGIDIIDSTTPVNVDFWVVLFNASNGAVQSPYGAARIQILDTTLDTVEVFPLANNVLAIESDIFAEVTLLRSGPIDQMTTTVFVSTMDVSIPGELDYFPIRNRNFTFMLGQYMLRVRVLLTDNLIVQGSRFFYVEYSVFDASGSGNSGQVEVEILDDDLDFENGPSFGLSTYVFFAGTLPYVTNENRGEVEITIYRIGDLNITTEIEIYTLDGTALEYADYQPMFNYTLMTQYMDVYQFSIPIVQDTISEIGTEEYFLVGMNVLAGGQLGRPNEGTVRVNIRPDPREDVFISLDSSQYQGEEGDILLVEVLRAGATNAMTSVEVYFTSGTAVVGEDFDLSYQEVMFPPGASAVAVYITLTDDSIVEDTETFSIELREARGGILAEPYSAIVTIIGDNIESTTLFQPSIPQSTTLEPPPPASSSVIPIVIGAIVGVIVIFGLVLIFLYFCCKRRAARPKELGGGEVPLTTSQKYGHNNSYLNRGMSTPKEKGPLAPMSSVDPKTKEYPRDQLRFHEEIGAGAFAVVYRAEAVGIHRPGVVSTVAVKMLKKTASETDKTDFMKELNVFKMLDRHDNVMSLLGCCTTEEPFYIILDYMPHGNIQSYLQRVRTGKERDHPGYLDATQRIIQPEEVLLYSSQVARGMEYLASKECIHRDLATRNILLDENHVCKVSDFGLARDVAGDQQYEMKSKGRVPVRWLAPECLFHNTYTSQSDVWSFGILMWELVTQGSHPYPGMSSQQVMKQVQHGYRLPKPDCCSQEIYDIMYSCWKEDPEDRPTFQVLRKSIEDMLSNAQGYLLMDCFQEGDYVYMTPGQESDDEDGLNEKSITAGKTNGKDKLTK